MWRYLKLLIKRFFFFFKELIPPLQILSPISKLPCLSPVRIQILILASDRLVTVSITPSCNLSSTAVAPNSFVGE